MEERPSIELIKSATRPVNLGFISSGHLPTLGPERHTRRLPPGIQDAEHTPKPILYNLSVGGLPKKRDCLAQLLSPITVCKSIS